MAAPCRVSPKGVSPKGASPKGITMYHSTTASPLDPNVRLVGFLGTSEPPSVEVLPLDHPVESAPPPTEETIEAAFQTLQYLLGARYTSIVLSDKTRQAIEVAIHSLPASTVDRWADLHGVHDERP